MSDPRKDLSEADARMQRLAAHFAALVERNKTRRRRDDDPPAALPMPVEPRGNGPLRGGAAAAMTFEEA